MPARRAAMLIGLVACVASERMEARAVDLRNVLSDYSLRSWGTKDGLPSSEVLAIAQDPHGFLWLGTDGGLIKFDGTRFTPEAGPPAGRAVRGLLVATNGELWVGLGDKGGALRYRTAAPGMLSLVEHHQPGDGLGVGAVRAMAEDVDGAIWVGHLGGLYRFAGGAWRKWNAQGVRQAEIHSLTVDRSGRLLVGTGSGVLVSRERNRSVFEPLDSSSIRDQTVSHLSVDANGAVWQTDPVHGFLGRVNRGAPAVPSEVARGQRLLHDREGRLWVGTGGQGLWRVSARADGRLLVEQSTVTTGLLGNGVVSVFEDREGNIWAGTLDGLNRLTRYVATPIQGLGLVSGVEMSPHGVWVMTADSLQLFARNQPPETPVVKYRGEVKAIHADEAGRLWLSTGKALMWFDERGRHDAPLSVSNLQTISLLASDRRGGLWLYDARRGLFRRSDEGLVVPTAVARAHLTWMDTTATGVLWAATADERLLEITPQGETREYEVSDGLTGGVVRAWHLGDDGSLWLGGASGLTLFRDGRFWTTQETHGNPLELVTAVVQDASGHLWIAMRSGMLRVQPSDLQGHMRAPGHPVPLAMLNKSDGLAGNPRWYGHRGAILDDRNRLWVVTSRGLSVVDPAALPPPRPIDARVDAIVVDGHLVPTAPGARLAPGARRLDIQFSALSLATPPTVRFRHRLDGFDRDWVDSGSERSASYTNLDPGAYTFRVMATSTDGTWPDQAATWSFEAEPMFYQTVWFRFLCLLVVLGIVGIGWRLHVRRVRAEMAILMSERARVAREIHDTLLQGLFGVALRCDAIAAQVETSAPQVSAHFLELRQGVERYVREARQSILGLRSPALEHLGLEAALKTAGEQLTGGSLIRFEFVSRGEVRPCRPDFQEHLLRIGQEAICNAVRHAHPSLVRAELRYDADDLVLQITDDGDGVDVDAAARAGGLGLQNMRERARAAGGVLDIVPTSGGGTRVEARVPYGHEHAA